MTKYRKTQLNKAFNSLYKALEQIDKAAQGRVQFIASISVHDEDGDCCGKDYEEFCRVFNYGHPEVNVISAECLLEVVQEDLKEFQLQEVLEKNNISSTNNN